VTGRHLIRAEFEGAGLLWSRRDRRRLARAGSGRGRRRARRWPCTRHIAFQGFTRPNVEAMALLAAPGLAPCDVAIDTRAPGHVVVTLRGPAADDETVEAVRVALDMRVSVCVILDVVLWSGAT
jgi:hypothetical protein